MSTVLFTVIHPPLSHDTSTTATQRKNRFGERRRSSFGSRSNIYAIMSATDVVERVVGVDDESRRSAGDNDDVDETATSVGGDGESRSTALLNDKEGGEISGIEEAQSYHHKRVAAAAEELANDAVDCCYSAATLDGEGAEKKFDDAADAQRATTNGQGPALNFSNGKREEFNGNPVELNDEETLNAKSSDGGGNEIDVGLYQQALAHMHSKLKQRPNDDWRGDVTRERSVSDVMTQQHKDERAASSTPPRQENVRPRQTSPFVAPPYNAVLPPPFFANPFVGAPFAAHLPQAQQSDDTYLRNGGSPNGGGVFNGVDAAAVRMNPYSGGFYISPQYYQELFQQYMRAVNAAGNHIGVSPVSEAGDVIFDDINSSNGEEFKRASAERDHQIQQQLLAAAIERPGTLHKQHVEEGNVGESAAATFKSEQSAFEDVQTRRVATEDGEKYPQASVPVDIAAAKNDSVGRRLAEQMEESSSDSLTTEIGKKNNSDSKRSNLLSPDVTMGSRSSSAATSSVENSPAKMVVIGSNMPHLEDGLSSEQGSDSELEAYEKIAALRRQEKENPTTMLIKKQIKEIENQLIRKAKNENTRKMDSKEVEEFLLEQQRTMEANFNLYEQATPLHYFVHQHPQDERVVWDKQQQQTHPGQRQFEAVESNGVDRQRTLAEIAAAATSYVDGDQQMQQFSQQQYAMYAAAAMRPYAPTTGSFVQPHFPQGAVLPQMMFPPPHWMTAAGGPAYPPMQQNVVHPSFLMDPHFQQQQQFQPRPAHHTGGYGMQEFLRAGSSSPPRAQPAHHSYLPSQLDQMNAMQALHDLRIQNKGSSFDRGSLNNLENVDTYERRVVENHRGGEAWPDQDEEDVRRADERKHSSASAPSHVDGLQDEPVWVLRDSYIRKMKQEEERRVLREREEAKQQQRNALNEADKTGADSDTDNETDNLLGEQRRNLRNDKNGSTGVVDDEKDPQNQKKQKKKKEVMIHEPAVLIEGVLFRAKYLGSTQIVCDGRPTKASRMMQAQEAVTRIKVPEGETQPQTDVDLFISTEKIMVLNTDLQDIMMDHPLRTISYIADISDLVVLMARRVSQSSPDSPEPSIKRTPKLICHVFESDEAQFIAQSIGQAFQVAYMEFLRANGIEDPGYLRELDYQEVLNSQEMLGEELELFARKETQKDVVVPKQKGEILGLVIVESGWGSMLPTVVVANLMPAGPAARCNQLNVGDHIIAVNGISFVGLPLSTCQNHIKNVKHLTAVKMTVVHTPPVVEVRIKRPDTKYQLGFSVQNGVICSLLRGGIAERGGVRVGHRIIEINGQSVVAVAHEKIVQMLATAVGEIQMKTMPTSMFRLLTGQEQPVYI